MREPPNLAHAAIIAALQANYGIPVRELRFLPLGEDSASSVYRAQAKDGTAYLLKARAGAGFSPPSLAIPHWLHGQGVPHVVAPLATLGQALWVDLDGYALSLYPFIEGRRGAEGGLSDEQWQILGATLRRIHASRLAPELMQIMPREAFVAWRRNLVPELEAAIARQDLTDPAQRELAAFWLARQDLIATVVDRADTLARELCQAAGPRLLCHADLHTHNVLVDRAEHLWIVDWDETILAPKERDLMFVVGGIRTDLVRPRDTANFLQGYGDAAIDPRALIYYRYAWAVQDIAAYAERVYLMPELNEESRLEAVRSFRTLFEPGGIVAIAMESEGAAGRFADPREAASA